MSRKKIIFIELFHHHECIENPFLYYKKNNYEVKLLIGEFVYKNLINIKKYEKDFILINQPKRTLFKNLDFFEKIKYIFEEFIENIRIIKRIRKIIKKEKPNFLYIGTIETPFSIPLIIYLLLLRKIKIITTIHNTNRLKISFLKYMWFDFLIKLLIKKSYKIVLLGKYLKFKNKEIQKKVIYFNNRLNIQKSTKKFKKKTFIVSGNLNLKEKDLESIFIGFSKLLKRNKNIQNKIQLVLLSKINNELINLIKKYKIENITKVFDSFVSEKVFENYMLKSHYSIISTYKNSIYGKYKISGSFGDAVGFNLKILLCEEYAPNFLDKKIIRFKKEKLNIILGEILK